jgi:hypothetical protein
MKIQDVVVVPSTLALLPSYTALEDPLPDVRLATREAVSWLVSRHADRLVVLGGEPRPDDVRRGVVPPAGRRIAEHLLTDAGFTGELAASAAGVLVVANGTAMRGEKAPGHLDDRARDYDDVLEAALRAGDPGTLRELDVRLGEELWAHDVTALARLGELADGFFAAEIDYAGDPYGVQYWVVRWTCDS